MLVNERQNEIYKYLQKHGSATVKTLAETFYVPYRKHVFLPHH